MAIWDQENNCVQQKEGDLLSRALNDLEIYNLRSKHKGKPQMTVLVDTMGMVLQASNTAGTTDLAQPAGQANQCLNQNATQDNDSLTNSIQSQTTMFTQAIHQMDALAEHQVAFENNTQSALETIMQQLAKINQHNRKCQHTQQYDSNHHKYTEDNNHSRLAADDSMEEDVGNT